MVTSRKNSEPSQPRRPPATTPEGVEAQTISMAVTLAQKQLAEGTASAQVITHYLKLATTREQLEQEKLRSENELLRARVESLGSTKRVEELYDNAIKAMRQYSGQEMPESDYED
jgi:hypothetical protein